VSNLSAAERAEILEEARAAALAAGKVLMEHFGRLSAGQVGHKGVERDLVTAADLDAERAIVARLRERFPGHAIEAEEETHERSSTASLRWFVDPLDGTVNFVHALPMFAVSIALYDGETPEVAVVHAPRLDETFWATREGGAFLDGRRIAVSHAERLGEAILATGFPYRRNELSNSNLENFNAFFYHVRGLRRMGSAALDLAYVAAGRLDGFWELHLAPHDVAAGALLVREAGGIVRDAKGGEDWLRGGHIVAAGEGLFEEIRSRIRV